MKRSTMIIAVMLILLLFAIPAVAQESQVSGSFPEGVIEIPMGTTVSIDEENTVTITNCPVEIQGGDTYVIYLEKMPLGFIAKTVTEDGNKLVIPSEKADPSIFQDMDIDGSVHMKAGMYEFAPAASIKSSPEFTVVDTVSYDGDTLSFSIGTPDGTKLSIVISDLILDFSNEGMDYSATISGRYEINIFSSISAQSGEIEVGEIRVYGVGKIALKIVMNFTAHGTFGGTFSSGFSVVNGQGRLIQNFTNSSYTFSGDGTIGLSLKLTAGLDLLVVEADIYTEIGIKTVQKGKTTYHEDRNPNIVECTDFKVYLFSTVGAEVKAFMNKIAEVEFPITDAHNSPAMLNFHIENGERVIRCSEGMDTTSIEEDLGGFTSDFDSVMQSMEERIVYKSIKLPFDFELDDALYLMDGGIDLAGSTLTINGDLYHSGGRLIVGNGHLIVHGNYYMLRDPTDVWPRQYEPSLTLEEGTVSVDNKMIQAIGTVGLEKGTFSTGNNYEFRQEIENNTYLDSTGNLIMNKPGCVLNIGGSLILQTKATNHKLTEGTIHLMLDYIQNNPINGSSHFSCQHHHVVDLLEDHEHILHFDDAMNNQLCTMTFYDDIYADSDISISNMELNGNRFEIAGNLIKNGSMVDPDYGTFNLNSGILEIEGTFHQTSGRLNVGSGKLTVGGNYYVGNENMDPEADQITRETLI